MTTQTVASIRVHRHELPFPLHLRASIRFFAFLVGDGALVPPGITQDDFYYIRYTTRPSPLLGEVFAIYINGVADAPRSPTPAGMSPKVRAAQWLRSQCDSFYHPAPPISIAERDLGGPYPGWANVVKAFAHDLGMGVITPDLLGGRNYVPELTGCGSVLEQIFATLCNVMILDESGNVLNATHARRRAAEHVRCLVDPEYSPSPPFTEEETALYML